jgi:rhodanese-related sulfurtransferase
MAKQHSPRFLKIVQESKSRVRETNVPEVRRRLDRGEKLNLVDVREDHEWANGHLPGATHLGKGVIERDAEKTFPDPGQELILYCGGGFRSALAAENLQRMGYTNVLSMDGGYTGWKEAGLPIAGGAGNPTAGVATPASSAGDSLKKQGDKLGDAVP